MSIKRSSVNRLSLRNIHLASTIYVGSAKSDVAKRLMSKRDAIYSQTTVVNNFMFTPVTAVLLAVGGGGSGGGDGHSTGAGGGGGGGQVVSYSAFTITSSGLTGTVGAGGVASGAVNYNGNAGGTTTVLQNGSTIVTALGGSGGGSFSSSTYVYVSGGSGFTGGGAACDSQS